MGKFIEVKLARTSEAEITKLLSFLRDIERVFDDGYYEDDQENEIFISYEPEARLEFIEQRLKEVSPIYNRVLWNAANLLKNCSDPNSETLELHPDIKELIDSANRLEELHVPSGDVDLAFIGC